MPIYAGLSLTEDGGQFQTERYARDLREFKDRELQARRRLLNFKELKLKRAKDGVFVAEKQLFYRRFAQAMRHRGYDRATTAQHLMEAFQDKRKRGHNLMRSLLNTLLESDLDVAMAQHPQIFTHEEVEAMSSSRNKRETLQMLARTTYDQRALAREMVGVLRVPVVAVLAYIGIMIWMLWAVVPMLETDVFPYVSSVPPFFGVLVNVRTWLFNPWHAVAALVSIATLGLGFVALYQHPAVQAWIVSVIYRNSRGYGRVRHGMERRRIYTAWIQTLQADGIDKIIDRGIDLATSAGKRALERAKNTPATGINPLTPLRAAIPFLPSPEVALIIAAFDEGGVNATRETLQEINEEINESIPFDIQEAKEEIRITTLFTLGGLLAFTIALLAGAILFTLFHIKTH